MGEIDPLVARVLLKGDDEFLNSLKRIGTEGVDAFERLAEASAKGAGPLGLLFDAVNSIEGVLSGAAAALVMFIEKETELSMATELLATAFGVTADQLMELETIFASSGVQVEQFERLANRLTITIAREWPSIAEAVRRYADANEEAQLRTQNALARTEEAEKKVAQGGEDRAARRQKNDLDVAETQHKLSQSNTQYAQQQVQNANSVRGAELAGIAARQHLSELESGPVSDAEKKSLAIAQAQLAVRQADEQLAEARTKKAQEAEEHALAQKKLEQEAADAKRKRAREDQNDRDEAARQVRELHAAELAEKAEAEKETTRKQSNPVDIASALGAVGQGVEGAKSHIDLTEVAVQNLAKGLNLLASQANAVNGVLKAPTGWQSLTQIARTLTDDVDHLITKEQGLALVNHLASTSMRNLGLSGAQIYDVLTHDADAIQHLMEHASKLQGIDPTAVREFEKALNLLNLAFNRLSQRFAAAIAPGFTAFLNMLRNSLENDDGILHKVTGSLIGFGQALGESMRTGVLNDFGAGLSLIAGGISDIGSKLASTNAYYAKSFDIAPVTLFKGELIAVGLAIAAWLGPWALIPVAIMLVVTAIGEIKTHWEEIKASLMDNAITQWWEKFYDVVAKVKSLFSGSGWKNPAAQEGTPERAAAKKEYDAQQEQWARAKKEWSDNKAEEAKSAPNATGPVDHYGNPLAVSSTGTLSATTSEGKQPTRVVITKPDGTPVPADFNRGIPLPPGVNVINGQDASVNGGAPGSANRLTAMRDLDTAAKGATTAVQGFGDSVKSKTTGSGSSSSSSKSDGKSFDTADNIYQKMATGIKPGDESGAGGELKKVAEAAKDVTEAFTKLLEPLGSLAQAAAQAAQELAKIRAPGSSSSSSSGTQDGGSATGSGGGASGSFAEGGMIDGPGTSTSDSIFARLSSGEFVMKARAVAQYGANFMHMINEGIFPGFALGGLVPSPVRLAGGGSVPASSTLNLSIDGRTFGSLRGSQSTIDDLTSFAIGRQTSAAGNNPSWMK